ISPIFTQFIDVVYQIMRVEPHVFEFNERFLFEISEHSYSCQFGTFLGNCDKDRTDLRVYQRTKSLWKHMESNLNTYSNPFYKPNSLDINRIELPYSAIVVWSALYNRFDTGIQPREYLADLGSAIKEHNVLMERMLKGDGDVGFGYFSKSWNFIFLVLLLPESRRADFWCLHCAKKSGCKRQLKKVQK
uniref:Myotubularin phosphatase domain-containing protein n=1 Tax=Bursaphelenchus xylophilus TaxID=6326 RepID=A0A1I7SK46_BURXY